MIKIKNNNTVLGAILVVFITIIILNYFLLNKTADSADFDRDKFRITNTESIDKVVCIHNGSENTIEFLAGNWVLNRKYRANPVNIRLLFATVNQVNIRRQISGTMLETISDEFTESGFTVKFFDNEQLVREMTVWGDEENSITYLKEEADIYLVEIPGYNAYISGLLKIVPDEWRHPNLFHKMAWRNLGGIRVEYPESSEPGFEIKRGHDFFEIEGIEETDTTKLINYIDHLSLIEVDEYLDKLPEKDNLKPILTIRVFDVGDHEHQLQLFELNDRNNPVFGSINEESFMKISRKKIEPLLKTKNYFKP